MTKFVAQLRLTILYTKTLTINITKTRYTRIFKQYLAHKIVLRYPAPTINESLHLNENPFNFQYVKALHKYMYVYIERERDLVAALLQYTNLLKCSDCPNFGIKGLYMRKHENSNKILFESRLWPKRCCIFLITTRAFSFKKVYCPIQTPDTIKTHFQNYTPLSISAIKPKTLSR